LSNEYTCTDLIWIFYSLKGLVGVHGKDGRDGVDGKQGLVGPPGMSSVYNSLRDLLIHFEFIIGTPGQDGKDI
jgi:hypothetical protein